MKEIKYLAGLDLGQTSDYTALAILERTRPKNGPNSKQKFFAVRHLERFPLGTSYTTICDRVVDLFDEPPLANGTLAIDQTGVGL
jgi:hypothetical protein